MTPERIRPRPPSRHSATRRAAPAATAASAPAPAARRHPRNRMAIPAALAVIAWGAAMMMAPPPLPSAADTARTAAQSSVAQLPAQSLTVDGTVPDISVVRDGYTATDGAQTLAANGTNYDWAKLVLVFAGWPTTESNITVITRWMRQENGVDNWWNRNNPLNNGWGSGGGSGLGSYDSLVTAAENCADALHRNSGYTAIAAGFAASAPTGEIEAAIWASPWASSHYANGSHWSSRPADVVKAPDDAWG